MTESPVDRLLATLDLQEVGAVEVNLRPTDQTPAELPALVNEDVTVFLGQSERMPHHRVFGGQVLAQGVIACGRTITLEPGAPPRPIHSLHAYFMRPGDDEAPIHFAVERMRDGASFSTRRMHAIQHGKPILAMSASFQEVAGGLDHQDEMPTVPAPEDLPSMTDLFGGINEPRAQDLANRRPIDMRHNDGHLFLAPAEERTAEQSVWMRTKGALPDDPLIHAAVLAYSSDYSLLDPSCVGTASSGPMPACGSRASITPCGSTARRAPTIGCSTRSSRRPPRAAEAWPSGGCSAATAR